MEHAILGLDIGGTSIKAGLLLGGQLQAIRSIPTPALESQELILETLAAFIESYLPQSFAGIGIGIPGLVDAQMGIVLGLANIPSFQHVELRDFLVNRFGKPVWINNDANCFALGVHQFGIGQGFQNLVGITLGTGVGAGIIIHGKLYSGVNSAAGEWCGTPYLDRTFEDYCSGKFFNRVYQSKPKTLAKLAQEGDPIALQAFDEFGRHVGELLKVILFSLAPEAIVLGGSIRKTYPLFEKSMRATLQTFPYTSVLAKLQVLVSDLDETAIHGAVALVNLQEEPATQSH
ncbi:MAG: ROK family protein [Algoriphagus sp.]|jgi:glucokinase|uniref:ROK family protein n=1 Tax=Algoriphagus sp. TaxID=1872435 RepID=UPI0027545F0B|nr:ROK family protein [Algoriphagus sp.]MDP4748024.1 ROK family protein [Algoriphagus sp.]MDP4838792.1 ROK family protein [Algoriphagus sp.]MDP4903352.1 ROK family protein [Algoriphagus sp.]MDP4957380.1 ROK family protein [Algoriphagus sp.]